MSIIRPEQLNGKIPENIRMYMPPPQYIIYLCLSSQVGAAASQALPPGWELRKTADGKPYFVDHNTRKTTFEGATTKMSPLSLIVANSNCRSKRIRDPRPFRDPHCLREKFSLENCSISTTLFCECCYRNNAITATT